MSLAVTFGDAKALAGLRDVLVADADADLAPGRAPSPRWSVPATRKLPPLLHKLVAEPALRGAGTTRPGRLRRSEDAGRDSRRLSPRSPREEKRDALNTLASRAAYGKALLDAVAAKKIAGQRRAGRRSSASCATSTTRTSTSASPRSGASSARRRPTGAKLIADWTKKLNAPAPPPDLALGRAIFAKTCQQCHTLFGVGGKVGPDITGSNRANLDYLLENILDPSAVIPKEYAATIIDLKSGRVITGIVRGETPAAFTVVTANETLTVPRTEIDSAARRATCR